MSVSSPPSKLAQKSSIKSLDKELETLKNRIRRLELQESNAQALERVTNKKMAQLVSKKIIVEEMLPLVSLASLRNIRIVKVSSLKSKPKSGKTSRVGLKGRNRWEILSRLCIWSKEIARSSSTSKKCRTAYFLPKIKNRWFALIKIGTNRSRTLKATKNTCSLWEEN